MNLAQTKEKKIKQEKDIERYQEERNGLGEKIVRAGHLC